jgi:hypothetical protein
MARRSPSKIRDVEKPSGSRQSAPGNAHANVTAKFNLHSRNADHCLFARLRWDDNLGE